MKSYTHLIRIPFAKLAVLGAFFYNVICIIRILRFEQNLTLLKKDLTHAVVHMGPHKTGSSFIQRVSKILVKELESDGYEMPWVDLEGELDFKTPPSTQVQFATCFFPESSKLRQTYPCKDELLESAKLQKNIFISSEDFYAIDEQGMVKLRDFLSHWDRVTIVLFYRRFFDRAQSIYCEEMKYKPRLDLKAAYDRIDLGKDYGLTHPPEEQFGSLTFFQFIDMCRRYFDDVKILNYHDPKKSIHETLFCALPNSQATCAAAGELAELERVNEGNQIEEYTKLVLTAIKMGMVNSDYYSVLKNINIVKSVVEMTSFEFKMICPSNATLEYLRHESLDMEKKLFPTFFKSPFGESALIEEFNKQSKKQLCEIDRNTTLEGRFWREILLGVVERRSRTERRAGTVLWEIQV